MIEAQIASRMHKPTAATPARRGALAAIVALAAAGLTGRPKGDAASKMY